VVGRSVLHGNKLGGASVPQLASPTVVPGSVVAPNQLLDVITRQSASFMRAGRAGNVVFEPPQAKAERSACESHRASILLDQGIIRQGVKESRVAAWT